MLSYTNNETQRKQWLANPPTRESQLQCLSGMYPYPVFQHKDSSVNTILSWSTFWLLVSSSPTLSIADRQLLVGMV